MGNLRIKTAAIPWQNQKTKNLIGRKNCNGEKQPNDEKKSNEEKIKDEKSADANESEEEKEKKEEEANGCKSPKLVGECYVDKDENCTSTSKLVGQAYCHEEKCACREGRITKKIIDDYYDLENNHTHHFKKKVRMECWVLDEKCGSAGFNTVLKKPKPEKKPPPHPPSSPPAKAAPKIEPVKPAKRDEGGCPSIVGKKYPICKKDESNILDFANKLVKYKNIHQMMVDILVSRCNVGSGSEEFPARRSPATCGMPQSNTMLNFAITTAVNPKIHV